MLEVKKQIPEAQAGYRLMYLELLNWGTFDHVIWRIKPEGKTTLLTGANGSGKTTIVDALLTLLVPTTKRFYNQSSGADQKKDRDERSYMLGYYSKTLEEGKTASSALKLREIDDHSILLGCFYNPVNEQYLSIAQVRWFAGSEIKRAFIVAQHQFSIQEHIQPIDTRGDWRKRLKKLPKTEVFDSFKDYGAELVHRFGLRSEKALWLFGKTVGVKDIGQLNEFIRVNMLEEYEPEEDFKSLREHYETLLSTYNSIRKAKAQIELLTPVVEYSSQFEKAQDEFNALDEVKQILPAYYAEKENLFLEQANSDDTARIKDNTDREDQLKKDIGELHNKEIALNISISQNEAGRRIKQIEEALPHHGEEKDKRQKKSEKYDQLAKDISLKTNPSDKEFVSQRKKAESLLAEKSTEMEALGDEQFNLRTAKQKLEEVKNLLTLDIESFRSRKSQIPTENVLIRNKIAEAIGVEDHELPFAGELIKVREDEGDWEAAIENLLRDYGLQILIPEKHYRLASRYINEQRLGKLVTYLKVEVDRKLKNVTHNDRSVFYKIDIKTNHPFEGWLEQQFAERLDYICCEMEDFQRSRKALTKQGQSRNGDRHRKDDRPDRLNRNRFILGWDNKERIIALETELSQLNKDLESNSQQLKDSELKGKRLTQERDWLRDFIAFELYSEIDWKSEERKMKDLTNERESLLQNSKDLQRLNEQLEQAKEARAGKEKQAKDLISDNSTLKERITSRNKEIEENELILNNFSHVNLDDHLTKVTRYLPTDVTSESLTALKREKKSVLENVSTDLQGKSGEIKTLEKNLTKAMSNFITAPRQQELFPDWKGDVMNFQPLPDQRNEYRGLYERILKEQLPGHQERFRKYMSETAIEKITEFKTTLENRVEEIDEHIGDLNESLMLIDFEINPPTYIQLRCDETRDKFIRDFKDQLREALPDTGRRVVENTDELLEAEFLKIKELIDALAQDEPRRKKVLDVRNWLEFSAQETYRQTGEAGRYYDSSGSTSGGERAQFTYTVLAAAIAFQFGINRQDNQQRAMRFIAVDEAFSKLDPDKSLYLMKLCERLDLQLLVVTPLDKIHIVEPFISACHYVENKNRRTSSVYNLTIEEYHSKKADFQNLSDKESA